MCVSQSCVNGPPTLDVKTSHLPLGDQLCHEFILSEKLHRMRLGVPPDDGMMYSVLSGLSSINESLWQNTIHLPSGEKRGK